MSLILDNVSKIVGTETHVYPTDLELSGSTMNVLLGPTLSGKTTLMRLMAGLDKPSTGKVFWNGEDVTDMRVQDRKVAMVYQQFINYPSMSVYENIASPLRTAGAHKAEIDKAVHETAEMLKLTSMLERKPLELSGGQQQRCALARALVKKAGLVLLDEPLASLDYKLREELRVDIPRIFEESGAIFVYATTEPEEALLLGGNTATFCEGHITQFGPTLQVYRTPVDVTTARVFSDPPMNLLNIRKEGAQIYFGHGRTSSLGSSLTALSDGEYIVGFRPNHLELDRHTITAMEFQATLIATELTGSQTFVHLDHDGEHWIGLVRGIRELEIGGVLTTYLDPSHVYIFSRDGRIVAPAAYALANTA
ncbi:MAG: ABC transporter ATP-binding protein [Rhodobacteraceae bacterium]|nr:ABC transporter ATP-binding protein [Paracoccaceae bacterium]